MTELDLVTGLRRAVHARTVRGSVTQGHDHHGAGFPLSYASTPLEDRQTMLCGGTAYWLYHLYKNLGLPTFVMNTGHPDGAPSHVMTFVRISHEGRSLWCMQDAYLNMTYVNDEGRPLCLTEIYESLARRQYERIVVSTSPGLAPVLLRHLESDAKRFDHVRYIAARQGVEIRTPSEDIVYLEWNYHSFPIESLQSCVRAHFGSDHLALLLALPLGNSGETYAEDFQRLGEDVHQRLVIG